MENKEGKGFIELAKKSITVLSATLAIIFPKQDKAFVKVSASESYDGVKSYNNFQKRILDLKLVLQPKFRRVGDKLVALQHHSHSSHSSHSSHYSSSNPGHTSHSSHTSHYSSSPTFVPSPSSKAQNSDTNKSENPSLNSLTKYALGSRVLFKGCEGTDVEDVQKILIKLNYDVSVTGIFDDKTDLAVKKFQYKNNLVADGKVDKQTLTALVNK